MPHLTAQQRRDIAQSEDISVADLAKKYGVSRTAVYNILNDRPRLQPRWPVEADLIIYKSVRRQWTIDQTRQALDLAGLSRSQYGVVSRRWAMRRAIEASS